MDPVVLLELGGSPNPQTQHTAVHYNQTDTVYDEHFTFTLGDPTMEVTLTLTLTLLLTLNLRCRRCRLISCPI